MTRFERRLYIGFAILVLLFTPILVGSFVVISELETTQGDLLSKNAQDVIEAERLSSLIHEEFGLVQGFVLRAQPASVKQLGNVHQEFQSTATSLLRHADVGEDTALLKEMKQLENESYDLAQEAISLKTSGATIEEINSYFERNNLTRGARVLSLVDANVDLQNTQLQEARHYADRVAKRLVLGLILACGFALLATCAVVALLFQMIRNKAREDRERDERLKLELDLSNARKEAVEVVAHDLKNPLSSLKMSLELLRDGLGPSTTTNDELTMAFQIAERSAESMRRLIDDQLDHTKIESGQLVLDKKIVNMAELLRDIELRYRPLMAAKDLKFDVSFDRALVAEIDPARIDQVISNLLGNAVKFTPSGGLVQLTGRRRANEVVISVKDNGPGIAKEALAHVFERYWQVRETAKKGTGLGLAIAKGIAEAHGGQLKASSSLGVGSEFELSLRAADLDLPAPSRTSPGLEFHP